MTDAEWTEADDAPRMIEALWHSHRGDVASLQRQLHRYYLASCRAIFRLLPQEASRRGIEMAERYGKPVFLSETGAEGTGKPSWLHYVCNEVRDAMERGADIRGICWYPITAYPGWDNSRHAETGLLSTVVANGTRHVDERLLTEFEVQRGLFAAAGQAGGRRLHIAR